MAFLGGLMTRLKAANRAFREPDLISDPLDIEADFNDFASRRNRYELYWDYYQNSQYTETVIHKARIKTFKKDLGLYKYIQSIYSPVYRLGEFWKAHLWGGSLDTLPIMPLDENNEVLIEAIAQIFLWSNWAIKKDVVSLYGAILGDVGLKVVEDVARGKVYLEVVHPGTIAEVDLDVFGNVKSYMLEEERQDPTVKQEEAVIYSEIAIRDGEDVLFQTRKDGVLFPWNGMAAEWSRPYGFVPMVMIQHNNVGIDWGFSEIHPSYRKFAIIDDLASKLGDQIRKIIDPIWLFSGVQQGSGSVSLSETNLTGQAAIDRPQPGREETPALYADKDATATPLVAPLDIAETSEHIKGLLKEVEKDHPEINESIVSPTEIVSGRQLKLLRQPVETKVKQRRVSYDTALIRALQMSISIAGQSNIMPEFDVDSFLEGDLDFKIGDRPIFAVDPLDDLEVLQAKGMIVQTLTQAGASIFEAARAAGFTEDEAVSLSQVGILGEVER